MGMLNPILRIESMAHYFTCNNSLIYPLLTLLQGEISVPIKYTILSSRIYDRHPGWSLLEDNLLNLLLLVICSRPKHELFVIGRLLLIINHQ